MARMKSNPENTGTILILGLVGVAVYGYMQGWFGGYANGITSTQAAALTAGGMTSAQIQAIPAATVSAMANMSTAQLTSLAASSVTPANSIYPTNPITNPSTTIINAPPMPVTAATTSTSAPATQAAQALAPSGVNLGGSTTVSMNGNSVTYDPTNASASYKASVLTALNGGNGQATINQWDNVYNMAYPGSGTLAQTMTAATIASSGLSPTSVSNPTDYINWRFGQGLGGYRGMGYSSGWGGYGY